MRDKRDITRPISQLRAVLETMHLCQERLELARVDKRSDRAKINQCIKGLAALEQLMFEIDESHSPDPWKDLLKLSYKKPRR